MDVQDLALTAGVLALVTVGTVTLAGVVAGIVLERLIKALNLGLTRTWEYVRARFTVSTEFSHKDPAYDYVDTWFCGHPRARKKARNVKVVYDDRDKLFVTVPGPGIHWFWYHGPMWITVGTPAKTPGEEVGEAVERAFRSSSNPLNKDNYKITMFATNPDKMRRFMNESGPARAAS